MLCASTLSSVTATGQASTSCSKSAANSRPFSETWRPEL